VSVYVRYLSNAFSIMLEVNSAVARDAVSILMEPFMGGQGAAELGNGSSFACTADSWHLDTRRLWLSRVSLARLQERGMFTNV
jgi:hypothetical protein